MVEGTFLHGGLVDVTQETSSCWVHWKVHQHSALGRCPSLVFFSVSRCRNADRWKQLKHTLCKLVQLFLLYWNLNRYKLTINYVHRLLSPSVQYHHLLVHSMVNCVIRHYMRYILSSVRGRAFATKTIPTTTDIAQRHTAASAIRT